MPEPQIGRLRLRLVKQRRPTHAGSNDQLPATHRETGPPSGSSRRVVRRAEARPSTDVFIARTPRQSREMARLPLALIFGAVATGLAFGLAAQRDSPAIVAAKGPVPAGRSDRLVFAFQTTINTPWKLAIPHVHVVNANGSGRRQLTWGLANDLQPSAAPDGRWISFNRDGWAHVIRPDGRGMKVVLPRVLALERAWSPDGKRFLAVADSRLHLVDPDTGKAARLRLRYEPGVIPAWSPDGRRLAVKRSHSGDVSAIAVFDLASGRLRDISARRGFFLGSPTWLHDGKRIAFAISGGLWIADANGGGERRLLKADIPGYGPWLEASPVAAKIVLKTLGPDRSLQVEVVKVDQPGRRVVFRQAGPNAESCVLSLTWSPDGRRIAFDRCASKPRRRELWVMSADGGSKRRLTTSGFASWPSWLPHRST